MRRIIFNEVIFEESGKQFAARNYSFLLYIDLVIDGLLFSSNMLVHAVHLAIMAYANGLLITSPGTAEPIR